MRQWDQLLENYLRECEARGLSESVVAGRRRELERFGLWLKRRKPKPKIEGVGSDLILDYIRARTAFHSKASVCSVMSHIRCMGEYLVNQGVWQQNPLRWIQSPKIDPRRNLPRRIEREHMHKLFEQAGALPASFSRQLTITVLIVLYGTGMRRGELERLNFEDWDPVNKTLRIDSRKVNLQRVIPVSPAVVPYLESYLPQRQNRLLELGVSAPSGEPAAFFISRAGKRLSGFRVSHILHRLAKRANIPLVSVHQFRHSCASDLLEEGLGLHEVQKLLGHAFSKTTVRYTQVADPARKHAISLHPINGFLALGNGSGLQGLNSMTQESIA
jgi:site-specific recombinase XerD